MNYRYRSIRCPHGFHLESVGCEECGVRVPERAGAHLRRAEDRRLPNPEAPPTYKHQGKHGCVGNTNARVRYR